MREVKTRRRWVPQPPDETRNVKVFRGAAHSHDRTQDTKGQERSVSDRIVADQQLVEYVDRLFGEPTSYENHDLWTLRLRTLEILENMRRSIEELPLGEEYKNKIRDRWWKRLCEIFGEVEGRQDESRFRIAVQMLEKEAESFLRKEKRINVSKKDEGGRERRGPAEKTNGGSLWTTIGFMSMFYTAMVALAAVLVIGLVKITPANWFVRDGNHDPIASSEPRRNNAQEPPNNERRHTKVKIYTDEREARLATYKLIHDEESRRILLRGLPELLVKSNLPSNAFGRFQRKCKATTEEVRGYFGDYLDTELYERFKATPTEVLVEGPDFFKLIAEADTDEWGHYHPGTNIIVISMDARFDGNDIGVLTHEHLHFLAELGRDDTREYHIPTWLNEGFTEMYELFIARRMGSGVSYLTETTVALYIEHILGEKNGTAWYAYINGDERGLETEFDTKLGKGTFDGLVENQTPEGGWRYIRRKMREKNIDFEEWERIDRILRRIGKLRLIE